MIAVHRIYFGHCWRASGLVDDLVRIFDSARGLLYAACMPSNFDDERQPHATGSDVAIKLSMAQCHVAVLWGGTNDPADDWSMREAQVARSLFRSSIPILANDPRGCGRSAERMHLADRIVGWSAADIARAVGDLANIATENLHLGRDAAPFPKVSNAMSPNAPRVAVEKRGKRRPLPVDEIADAYRRLRTSRSDSLSPRPSM
jgi:hypothetical protein